MDPVMVVHKGRRLGLHGDPTIALFYRWKYPLSAEVVRIRDGHTWTLIRLIVERGSHALA
jgi:hypothetical protein